MEKKGSLYKDLMNAVAEARRTSLPEFCGFVWKQGAADGRRGLAEEYYENFKQLVSDLSDDLGVSRLPTFVPSYAKDGELLRSVLSRMSKTQANEVKKLAGQGSVSDGDLLHAALSYMDDKGLLKDATPAARKQRYLAAVIAAQNRAGRDIPNVTTLYPGKLPIGDDGVHYSSAGYITLGKITADAVEAYYRANK